MAGQTTPFGSNVEIMDVHNCLDNPSLDLGTLCTASNINQWSLHKPVYYIIDNACISDWSAISGFKAVAVTTGTFAGLSQLVYNPPVDRSDSSKHSMYRLDDFWYYDHNARKPQQHKSENNILKVQFDNNNSQVSVSLAITLPNTEVIHAMMNQTDIKLKNMIICGSNMVPVATSDTTSPHKCNDAEAVGKAIYDITTVSETDRIISSSFSIDRTGQAVGTTWTGYYYVTFGSSSEPYSPRYYIPGMETITVTVKLINTGLAFSGISDGMDAFPPYGITSITTVPDSITDFTNNQVTLGSIRIDGVANNTSYPNRGNFTENASSSPFTKYGTSWVVQYIVYDSLTTVKSGSTYQNLSPSYVDAHVTYNSDGSYGTFSIFMSNVVLSNVASGDYIHLKIEHLNDNTYWKL